MKNRRNRNTHGFTLLAVLTAVALVAGFVAAYGRHVVVESRAGMASPSLLASRESCHSGLQYVRQALVAGGGLANTAVPAGESSADVAVEELLGGHFAVQVDSVNIDGLGARRTAEIALQPSAETAPAGPSSLPNLHPDTVYGLQSDPTLDVHHFTSSQILQGAEYSGLLVVHPGVTLQLDDVVIDGAIVSAAVMDQAELGSYNAAQAPRILVAGNVSIDAHSALPGISILMPDGAVASGGSDARIQVHGDVVAHDISLLLPGALNGNVSGVEVELAAGLDRLGADRRDPAWSDSLQLGGKQEPVFMAIVPPSTSLEALSPIVNYWQGDA